MDPKRVLFTFLSVYKHRSQLEAATHMNLTQPAVSQHIKWLESKLNQKLFIKKGRHLIPTLSADNLAARLYQPVEALEGIWDSIQSTKQTNLPLHFGSIAEFFSVVFAPELYQLTEKGIQLYLHEVHPNELEMLKNGHLHIAHLFGHTAEPGIEIMPFFKEAFCLIGHPKYLEHLPKKKSELPKALFELPWITYDKSFLFIRDYFMQMFETPFQGNVAHQLCDLWSILAAVRGGAGITVLPHFYLDADLKSKKVVLLHEPKTPPLVEFYLAWRAGSQSNPAIAQTIDFMIKAARKTSL